MFHPEGQTTALWGDLDEQEVDAVLGDLNPSSLRPATKNLPNTQWAAVVQRPDGSIAATASTLLESGLFWSVDQTAGEARLIIATSLEAVVRARRQVTTLDEDYIRGFVLLQVASGRTPYAQVHRIRPGVTSQWKSPGSVPKQAEWSGPDVWPSVPTSEGPHVRERYLATFDAAIAAMLPHEGPTAAFLSGGLDSSFVVAALAMQATPEAPVVAFSHAPHPDAQLEPSGNWDPDDSHFAAAMQRAYPGRVVVHRVFNESLVASLDAAIDAARRSWVPTPNPGNQVWFSQIESLATQLGATKLFSGESGNLAFSHEPDYAVGYYLRRAEVRAIAALVPRSSGQGVSRAGAALTRFLGTSIAHLRQSVGPGSRYDAAIGLQRKGQRSRWDGRSDRREYLEELGETQSGLPACLSPAGRQIPILDPFRAATVLELAASITPKEWCTGPYPRGFARRLGEGRVPDDIRLRTRRGGQALDNWYVTRTLRDRYYDEIHQLDKTPSLAGWIDSAAVQRTVDAWPWGEVHGPNEIEVVAVETLLSLAEFVRMTEARLRQLSPGVSPLS